MSSFQAPPPRKRNPELDLPPVTGRRARALPTHQEAKFSQMTHNGKVDRILHFSPVHEPFLVYFSLIPDLTYVGSHRVGPIPFPNPRQPTHCRPPVQTIISTTAESADGLNVDAASSSKEVGEESADNVVAEEESKEEKKEESKEEEDPKKKEEDTKKDEDVKNEPEDEKEPDEDGRNDDNVEQDPLEGEAGNVLVRYYHYYKYLPLTPYIMHQIIRHHVLAKRIVVTAPKPKAVFHMKVPTVARAAMNINSCSWWFQCDGVLVVKEDRWEPSEVVDGPELDARLKSVMPYCLSLRDDCETQPRHRITNLWMARCEPLWVASTVPELFLRSIVQVDSKVQAHVLMNRLIHMTVELRDFDYDHYYGRGERLQPPQDEYQIGIMPSEGAGTDREVRTRLVQRYKVLLRESVSRMPELAIPHNTPGSYNILGRLPSIWLGPPDLHADGKSRQYEGKDVVRGPVIGLFSAIGPIFTRVATPLYPSVGPFNALAVHSTRQDVGPPCNASMTVKNRQPFLRKYKERGMSTVSKYVAPHPYVGTSMLLGNEIAKFDDWVVSNICASERKGFLSGNKRLRSEPDRRAEEADVEARLMLAPAKLEDFEPLFNVERRSWLHETLQDMFRRHHACVQLIGIAQDQIVAHEKKYKGFVTLEANAFSRNKALSPLGGSNITNMHLLGKSRKESGESKPEPAFTFDPAELASVDAYWALQASYHPERKMMIDVSGFAVDVTGDEYKSLRKKWLRLTHRFHEDIKTHLPIICVGGVPLPPIPIPGGAASIKDHFPFPSAPPAPQQHPPKAISANSILEDVGSLVVPATVAPSQPQPTVPAAPIPVAALAITPGGHLYQPTTGRSSAELATPQTPQATVAGAETATAVTAATPSPGIKSKGKELKRKHRRSGKHASSSDDSDDDQPPPPPPNRPPPTKWRRYIDSKTKEPYFVLMGYRDIPAPANRHGESGQGAPSPTVQTERVVLDTVWERPEDFESD